MEVQGISLVECDPYRMQLTRESCASNWASVAGKPLHTLDRLHKCLGCPHGAQRAGRERVPTPLPRFCCRCLKLSPRLIGKRLCPSCYNRERELAIGQNARGTVPVKVTPIYPVKIHVNTADVSMPAASRMEVAMYALRSDLKVSIGWAAGYQVTGV